MVCGKYVSQKIKLAKLNGLHLKVHATLYVDRFTAFHNSNSAVCFPVAGTVILLMYIVYGFYIYV